MTDYPLARPSAWRRRAVLTCALAAILLGALALIGWALNLALLTRTVPAWPSMKPNTALLVVLAGGALLGLARPTPRRFAVGAASAVVLVIAIATIVEHVAGVDLGIDEWLFRDAETARDLHPGRMAVATALALLLTGAALLLVVAGARRAAARRVARVLSGGIVALGGLGLLGHLFRVIGVYTWYPVDSVALPTGAALVLLGVGLLVAERTHAPAPRPLSEDEHIIRAAALALALAAGVTGVLGVIALESHVRRSAEGELQSLLTSQVAELTTNLELRATRAAIVTTRPNLRRYLRILVSQPNNRDARQVVEGVLDSFLSHDFSRLVATLPGGEEVARAGDEARTITILEAPLGGSETARLLWRNGMALRHELALTDAAGPLGTILTEQRMPRVSEMLTGNPTRFVSAEFLLCRPDGLAFRCFPSRLSADPVVVPPGERSSPPLARRALLEGAGVSRAVDYRGHQVFGAYTPLPDLGLVAVLKVDMNELYAPARWQLGLAVLLVFAVTAGGVVLVRARVGPMATRLEQRVRERTADLERATARLSILHEIDRGLTTEQSPEDIAEATLGQLRDLLGVPRVMVILFDVEAGQAEWLAAAGRRRVRIGPGVRYSLELAGDLEALRRGEPQVIDVEALPASPETEALLEGGVRVYMVMPMIAAGALVGGLSFGGPSREFSPEQISIAEEVARQMAITIEHSRLLERVTRNAAELEERVRARTAELEAAQAELVGKERLATLGQLAGSVAHELRNPLGVIKNAIYFLRLALSASEDARVRKHLAILEREVTTSNRIISELLDYARRPTPTRVPIHLNDVVRECLDRVGAPEGHVELVVRLADDLPALEADPFQLDQILGNLIRNAVQAMPEGGRVTIETSQQTDGTLTLDVADTGVGIPPETLARIFEPLFTTKAKGVGLGLAIVQQLTEANGGVVEAASTPGQGTRFTLRFPRPSPLSS